MLQYNLEQRKGSSLYGELVRLMRADIASGKISADEHLPSKRDFARSLGVSVITVEHAYQQLIAEGYVRAVERKGYFANDIGSFVPSQIYSRQSGQGIAGASAPVGSDVATSSIPGLASSAWFPSGLRCSSGRESTEGPACESYRYDLTGGVAPGSFPRRAWARLLRDVVEEASDEVLLKAAPATGVRELKEEIARHVARFRGMEVHPSQVVVGAGSQVFYALLSQLLGPLGSFAVEDPGYSTLAQAYRAQGLEVQLIPIDEGGIDVAFLRASGASIAHVMPSHHFPTGVVMPISRRYELLGWASESSDRYIIEDDYDCEFRHQGHPIPALQGIDAGERVIYLNTFARSLAPSLRLGYMVLPPHLMQRFERVLGFYSSSVSTVEQLVLARFMSQGHFDTHVNRMRRRYREVRDAALSVVDEAGLVVSGKDAGLHFVLDCGTRLDEARLVARLSEQGVKVRTMGEYRHGATRASDNTQLVVCYSGLDAVDSSAAMRLVCGEIAAVRA